ncbi:hypothetical protein ABPG72_021379 [Tetrahymena utriculariae]
MQMILKDYANCVILNVKSVSVEHLLSVLSASRIFTCSKLLAIVALSIIFQIHKQEHAISVLQPVRDCDGPSSSNCLSCNLDRYYLADKKECYDICPSPYFSHFTKPDCLLTCPTDFQNYLFGNPVTRKCEGCNEACQQCTGSTNLDCVKCAAKYFYYQQNNSCLLTCPDNKYADSISMKCLPCDKSCTTCNGGSNSNCTSCLLPSVLYFSQCIQNCPNPLYKDEDLKQCVTGCSLKYPNKYADTTNMVCKYCHKYYNKCIGPSNDQCQKYKRSYFKYNDSCIEQCQPGTYQVAKKLSENEDDCKKCSSECETCYGPNNQNCLTCKISLHFLKKNYILSCLTDCLDQYIKDMLTKSCQACPSSTYFFKASANLSLLAILDSLTLIILQIWEIVFISFIYLKYQQHLT